MLAAMAILFFGALFATGATIPRVAVAAAAAVLLIAGICGLMVARRGSWECRIEGPVLSFHRPQDRGWIVMQIAEIEQVIDLRPGNHDVRTDLELVLKDGSRVLLDRRLIGNQKRFNRALRQAKPDLKFDRRDYRECYACGGELQGRRERCRYCDAPVATIIPPQRMTN